jgi:tRNA(Ile)-lysidine synthase
VQEAARKIRYGYFEELKNRGVFSKIITAHHSTDQLETFFINLYRTSGIQGLKGIPLSRDYIIRPFLALSSSEIHAYLISNNIPYRSDSSNEDTKYLRNTFRKEVLPDIVSVLPEFEDRALKSISFLREESALLDHLITKELDSIICNENDRLKIAKNALLGYPHPHLILYRIIDAYDYNPNQCLQIIRACNANSGKVFFSESSQLTIDREYIFVTENTSTTLAPISVSGPGIYSFGKAIFHLNKIKNVVFSDDKMEESIALTLDKFPLDIRNWEEGDRFQPLGMKGSKLLSDFFIDQKIDVHSKGTIPLLCSKNEVLWIPGYRISEKIRVKKNSNLFSIRLAE